MNFPCQYYSIYGIEALQCPGLQRSTLVSVSVSYIFKFSTYNLYIINTKKLLTKLHNSINTNAGQKNCMKGNIKGGDLSLGKLIEETPPPTILGQ